MLDVKHVVQTAVQFVRDMYQGEGIADLRLEEVERLENENRWMVTLSFTRPRTDQLGQVAQVLTGGRLSRDYKALTISGMDGAVESMKIRELESSRAQ